MISTMSPEPHNWADLVLYCDVNLILLAPGHLIGTFKFGYHQNLLDVRQTYYPPFSEHIRIILKQL